MMVPVNEVAEWQVERFDHRFRFEDGFGSSEMVVRENGDYVKFSDYAHLIAPAMQMLAALRKIAAEDDTGPLVFEVDDTGRSWPSHNAPGKFAEIANAVIAAATGEAK